MPINEYYTGEINYKCESNLARCCGSSKHINGQYYCYDKDGKVMREYAPRRCMYAVKLTAKERKEVNAN